MAKDLSESEVSEKEINFTPKKMVGWFNPGQLANTGLMAVISSMFGNYADKREVQASLAHSEGHDYSSSNQKDIWFDYTSDLGDGFDSTYSIARLLGRENIVFKNNDSHIVTKRGKVLIMGGDQVYPVASRENYKDRLIGPYNVAFPKNDKDPNPPHLFAIPGNHDWYDGLTNFTKLFCQPRSLGNWRTQQRRSYFAIKLSKNVWVWGIDIQLSSDVDKPQLEYFHTIMDQMSDGDKVILCTAEPSWVYSAKPRDSTYHNLEFFEKEFFGDWNKKKKIHLVVTLAGDLHHYARYSNGTGEEKTQKITSGGGGAFLHPTHNLPETLHLREGNLSLKKTFPKKSASKGMVLNNFLYPARNWSFACFMGCFYLLFAWMLQTATRHEGGSFLLSLSSLVPSFANLSTFGREIGNALIASPTSVILSAVMIFGLYSFADKTTARSNWAQVFGALHGLSHVIVNIFMLWIFVYINAELLGISLKAASGVLVLFLEMFLIGGGVGSMLMSFYLMASNLLLKNHDNEAFSALKSPDYKNFLRFHLTENQLTIYPIGITEVTRWKISNKRIMGKDAIPELIEEPIVVKL